MMFPDRRQINMFHFMVVGPFLAYIGYMGSQGEPLPEWTFQALLGAGVLAMIYHFMRYNAVEHMILKPAKEQTDQTWNEGFSSVAEPSEEEENY